MPTPEAIPSPIVARSRLAVAARLGGSPDVLTERRRDLAEANIAAFVERTLSKAPPLSDEQADRLAHLLRGTAA